MRGETDGRIAVFQADWPVQSQTANCTTMLAQAGYSVDLFLSNLQPWNYVDLKKLEETVGVKIYDIGSVSQPKRVDNGHNNLADAWRFKQRLTKLIPALVRQPGSIYARGRSILTARLPYWLFHGPSSEFLRPWTIDRTLEIMASKNYRCLIGVEKKGLIWAGYVAEKLNLPFIYYNLELYTDDYSRLVKEASRDFKRLRSAERHYHSKASATIIQDPDRARVLFQDNGLSTAKANMFYVPVSVMGGPYKNRSWFLHTALGIPKHQKIILYFGLIWENRYGFELAQAAQNFPEDWVLVMHGEDYDSAVEKIKTLDRRKRVIISLKMVPSDRIQEVVASADIGLAFYSNLIANDRLTAFSSEKMALYMQCGVPFISFDYPGYQRLANDDRCGLAIRSLQDLPEAIDKVLMSHEEFRRRAYQAFYKHYSFARNFAQVIEGIERL